MSRIKLDPESLGLSTLMERLSGTHVKDCFRDEESIYFIVNSGELGKAIGKGGITVKRVQEELGKKIRIIEYHDNIQVFVRNVIYPLTVERISEEEGSIILRDKNRKTKSLLIGRGGKNLLLINRAVKRFFDKEVKVE